MARERDCTAAEKCHLGFASRTRSEQSDEQSAEQLREVDHPEARIAHRGICASPDAIFSSHRIDFRGLLAWIDNYCAAHPLDSIASATFALTAELRRRRSN